MLVTVSWVIQVLQVPGQLTVEVEVEEVEVVELLPKPLLRVVPAS